MVTDSCCSLSRSLGPQMWGSRPPHPLPLGPVMTAMYSLVSPVIRAKGQRWTSKSQGGPGRVLTGEGACGPSCRRVWGSWTDPDYDIQHLGEMRPRGPGLTADCGPLPSARACWDSGEGRRKPWGRGPGARVSQAGMAVHFGCPRGPPQNALKASAAESLVLCFSFEPLLSASATPCPQRPFCILSTKGPP